MTPKPGANLSLYVLSALKTLVFKEKKLTASQVSEALAANFQNPGGELVRQRLLHAPKYGNDIADVDEFVARVLHDYLDEAAQYRHTRADADPSAEGMRAPLRTFPPMCRLVQASALRRMAVAPANQSMKTYRLRMVPIRAAPRTYCVP